MSLQHTAAGTPDGQGPGSIPTSAAHPSGLTGQSTQIGPIPRRRSPRPLRLGPCRRQEKKGDISVYCGDGAKFLREEEELIKEVAGLVSKAVEHREVQVELKQYAGKLRSSTRRRGSEGTRSSLRRRPCRSSFPR